MSPKKKTMLICRYHFKKRQATEMENHWQHIYQTKHLHLEIVKNSYNSIIRQSSIEKWANSSQKTNGQ